MVGELTDLRDVPPWLPDRVQVPLLVGLGSKGAAHHQRGMHWLADHVPQARLVELAGCGHDAPLSHPAVFAAEMVEPLLDASLGDG
jgi:pimeloyl-ACP methyl ester carboxylesterase